MQPVPLRNAHERRVSQIHREVGVLLHERAHAGDVSGFERQQLQALLPQHVPQPLLGCQGADKMHRLGNHRPDSEQRLPDLFQGLNAAVMKRIVCVDHRDERPRVNENAAHAPLVASSAVP